MLEFYFVSWGPKDLTARKHKNLTLPAKFVCCQFIRQTSRITIVLWFFCGHCQNKESLLFKVLAIVKRRTAEEDWKNMFFLFYTCISLWELIEILTKKYLREMYRATFIAQPVILGIMELWVIVVARHLYLMVSVCGAINYGNTYCATHNMTP